MPLTEIGNSFQCEKVTLDSRQQRQAPVEKCFKTFFSHHFSWHSTFDLSIYLTLAASICFFLVRLAFTFFLVELQKKSHDPFYLFPYQTDHRTVDMMANFCANNVLFFLNSILSTFSSINSSFLFWTVITVAGVEQIFFEKLLKIESTQCHFYNFFNTLNNWNVPAKPKHLFGWQFIRSHIINLFCWKKKNLFFEFDVDKSVENLYQVDW